ncbi:MAG: TonB-dependent receptor plug domain-containing protein, partial [Myxococcota bacterium]
MTALAAIPQTHLRFCGVASFWGALALSAGHAGAQAQPSDLEPPELIEEAAPVVPDGVEFTHGATVVLRITIGLDGSVTDVEVVESAGDIVDTLARDVLLRSRFRPARRAGEPIVSRVLYRWVFRPPVRPEPPREREAPATEASARGRYGPSERSPVEDSSQVGVPDDEEISDSGLGASARVQRDREGLLERSVEAVNVVDVAVQRTRARDLGDILSREQGVALQRAGGLGSGSRFTLNGLTDEQVRFFIDGVPLRLYGFDGVANYPVGPIESVEIFRGVLPVRLGADALGGAVNLRTGDDERRTFGLASYQAGSWQTHRTTLTARHYVPRTGLSLGVRGFFDRSANNYPIDVELVSLGGRLSPARARRFHDDYQAFSGNVDIGVMDRPWAKRLQLTLFSTGSNRDRQHNAVQTIPYGEVTEQRRAYGGVLRYAIEAGPWTTEVVASVGYSRTFFDDRSDFIYGWDGKPQPEVTFEGGSPQPVLDDLGNPVLQRRRSPGEISGRPIFMSRDGLEFFARFNNRLQLSPDHELWFSVTPQYATFQGRDRLFDSRDRRDPESVVQDLGKVVSGLEYRWIPARWGIEGAAFLKHNFFNVRAEDESVLDHDETSSGFTLGRLALGIV